MRIDFPFSLNELDKLFEVSDFLENKEEILNDIKPEVKKYLSKASHLKPGMQMRVHSEGFKPLVCSLLRREIQKHMDINPEELLILTEETLIDLLTDGFYYNKDNYN